MTCPKSKPRLPFNLTKRQLICFGIRAAIGIPIYLLTRGAIGNTGALFVMLGIMLPAFLMAMYERDGLPFEKVLGNMINTKFLRPGIRPYRTQNIYAPFTGKEESIERSQNKTKRKEMSAGRWCPPSKPSPMWRCIRTDLSAPRRALHQNRGI